MAMGETRRKFDHDFWKGAVRLVRETGKPVAQVARDLGINEGTLGNWVNADKRRRQRALLLDTITLSDGEDQRERTQCLRGARTVPLVLTWASTRTARIR
jgi:transposase